MTEGLRKRKRGTVEPKGDLNVFEWNIENFTEVFEDTEDEEKIRSPVFPGKSIELPNSFWRIDVYPKEENAGEEEKHLDAYLIFIKKLNQHNPWVKAKYKFFLLDGNQRELCRYEGENKFGPENNSWGFKMETHSELFDVKNKYLEDNMLRIRIKLWIQNNELTAVVSKLAKVAKVLEQKCELFEDLSKLFSLSKVPDVTVEVEDLTLKAHRNIMSCRSPVFAAMFQNEMSESRTHIIKIEDFSSKTVKGMIDYIYAGNPEIVDKDFVELLKIAEKYQLKDLKADSTSTAILNISVENVIELLILGDMYNAPKLKYKAMDFINSNKANRMFSQGKDTRAFEKLVKEHPMLLFEMYKDLRSETIASVVTRYTTEGD